MRQPTTYRSIRHILLLAACGLWHAGAAAQQHPIVEFGGKTMGPIDYRVKLAPNDDGISEDSLHAAVAEELQRVDQLMSTYREDSEVTRFNRSTSTDWFAVSPETLRVIRRGAEISAASNGAFDFTVGPLVDLWKFGPDKNFVDIPSATSIEQTLQRVGFAKLSFREHPAAIKKDHPQLQIDLSAIAKGFAVDQVANRLTEVGIESYLVEVGGELVARGRKRDGSAWIVGVEQPRDDAREVLRSFELEDKALASSGDYRSFRMVGGRRYSHTIDPRTGEPVENGVAAVSVIAKDCMTADALATALMVLGDSGLQLAQDLEAEALIVTRSDSGFRLVQTPGFPPAAATAQGGGGPNLLVVFLGAALIFGLVVLAMSVGVIFGRRRIQGSCGGIASLESGAVEPECSMCSAPSKQCREVKKAIKNRGAVDNRT